VFLERFGPVDPADLSQKEAEILTSLLESPMPLSVGWVAPDDEGDEEDDQ